MAGHKSRWLDKSPPSGRLISAFSQPAALEGNLDLPGLAEMIKKQQQQKEDFSTIFIRVNLWLRMTQVI